MSFSKEERDRLRTRFLELMAESGKLNRRPRKTLGWKTPAEHLLQLV